ncbi:MAG: RNA-binding S4 domain-containing protein [Sphingomonadaceae bacterium]|nr:RNA-binding S4 domain-containing protein [Sphingomonadaceae bacterium]
MRIDKLLFFLRVAKSRTLAQGWAEAGHIRVNGRRIEKGSAAVAVGDIITLPRGQTVLTLKLLAMPKRRGPAAEAQLCYQLLE